MFEASKSIFTKAVMDRLVLMLNHVIAAEPVAVGRLMPHAGKSIRFRFDGWPSLLPALPTTVFTITRAGLVEWRSESDSTVAEDLEVSVDASNPALAAFRALTGSKPDITVAGDAAFASDVNWLVDNLRWDIEDDIAKLIGDAPAHELARFGAAVNDALKKAAGSLRGFGKAGGPGAAGAAAPAADQGAAVYHHGNYSGSMGMGTGNGMRDAPIADRDGTGGPPAS